MPLIKSASQPAFDANIRTLMHDVGKSPHVQSRKQAEAIAFATQREAEKHADGGVAAAQPLKTGGVAVGTSKPVGLTTGPLVSSVPGRTDLHFTHVPSGAYVIPADIVSAHGQGNTLAGIDKLHKMFNLHKHTASTAPQFPSRAKKFAKGGADKHIGKPVPVKLAGGEIVLPPSSVHETMQRVRGKQLSMDEAHREMDKWVIDERKKLRKTLAKLPGPAKD
jgi:hypothetical protein